MSRSTSKPVAANKSADGSRSAPSLTTPEELRQKILRPYYPLLHDWLKHDLESAEIPQFVELEGRRVSLGSWEQQQFRAFRIAPAFGLKPDASLTLEGIAFQFAAHKLEQCFATGPMPEPEELPRFLDEIVAQLAVGIALESLLQMTIDVHVQQGKLAEARQITGFRSGIVQHLTDLKARVGILELERAEEAAPALTVAPVEQADVTDLEGDAGLLRLIEEMEGPLPTWASFDEEESIAEKKLPPWLHDELKKPESPDLPDRPAAAPSGRVKPMLVILAALICVYSVVIWPRVRKDVPPTLTVKEFSGIQAVQEVKARPPSLFVVVDGIEWDDSTLEARVEMVEAMGAVAVDAGYTGIHIRADEGRVVAEWLKNTVPLSDKHRAAPASSSLRVLRG